MLLRVIPLTALIVTALSAAPTPATAADVTPQSASGCTGSTVCINVVGSGLHVDSISGGVAVSGGVVDMHKWCGTVEIIISSGGNTYYDKTSPRGCANAVSPYNYSVSPNADYPNGSKVCLHAHTESGWDKPGGPACETVHS
ncbi:hypothetical protein [Streptomyces sp. NPDC001537]